MKYVQTLPLLIIILVAGCSAPSSCPNTCDDNNYCTLDYCSNETSFNCIHNMTYLNPILEDTMEGNISNWNEIYNTKVWSVNNGVLGSNYTFSQNSMPAYLFANINSFKGDYAITGKFNLQKGILILAFRITDNKGYLLLLQNSVLLMKSNSTVQGVSPSILALSQTPIPKNVWLNFKLINIGSKLIFYIEDRKLIDVTDEQFLAGNFGFVSLASINFDNSDTSIDSNIGIVQIDDIKIYEINSSNYLCIQ
jgi:hypothetical protein